MKIVNTPRFNFASIILTIMMGGMSLLMSNQFYAYIAIAVLTFLILKSNWNYAFYSVLGTVFFWDAIRFNGIMMGFFFSFMVFLKFLIDHRTNLIKSKFSLIVFFLMIFFFNDILYCDFSQIVNDLSRLLLLFVCLNSLYLTTYNHRYALLVIITSLVMCQIFSISISGGITYFLNVSDVYLRLGETDDTTLVNAFGGAMGFPVNSILICTFSMALLANKNEKTFLKCLLGVVVVTSLLIAFYSTSRVYLLGLSVMILLFVLKAFKTRKSVLYFALAIVGLIIVVSSGILDNYISTIESRYISRTANLSNDVSNGRNLIYGDIVSYLLENPHRILLGCGYRAYQEIGQLNHLQFAMSAHNFLLDALMAFGLYGIYVILSSCSIFMRGIRSRIPSEITIISIMPFVCWFSTSLTNSAFMLSKTYVLIPFFILHMYYGQLYLKNK